MTVVGGAIVAGTTEAVVGATISVTGRLLRRGHGLRRDEIESWAADRESTTQRAVEAALERLGRRTTARHKPWLLPLLEDGEIYAVARAMVAARLAGQPTSALTPFRTHLETLAGEYVDDELSKETFDPGVRERVVAEAPEIVGMIWTSLSEQCLRVVAQLTERDIVPGSLAEQVRTNVLDPYIQNVMSLAATRESDLPRLVRRSEILKDQRKVAARVHRRFEIHTPDGSQTYKIEDVYVRARLEDFEPSRQMQHRVHRPDQLPHRAVVLGDPGYLRSGLPSAYVEWCLSLGLVALLLDGLDEVRSSARRIAVRSAVESFAAVYPEVGLVVSSRVVGYEDNPLSEDFHVVRVLPLDREDRAEYVSKWFRAVREKGQADSESIAREVEHETRGLREIRTNPLLLGVICSLKNSRESIPRSLGDILTRCVELLYFDWEIRKGMGETPMGEALLRQLMEHIAYHCFESVDYAARGDISESELLQVIHEFVAAAMAARPSEADDIARQVIDRLSGRAWLLSDRGWRDGGWAFAFVHNTFLEFLTAGALVRRNSSSVERLARELDRLSQDARWVEVCFLAVVIWNGPGKVADLFDAFPPGERRLELVLHSAESVPLPPPAAQQVCAEFLDVLSPDDGGTRPPASEIDRVVRLTDRELLRQNRTGLVRSLTSMVDGATGATGDHLDAIAELTLIAIDGPSTSRWLDPRDPDVAERRTLLVAELEESLTVLRRYSPRSIGLATGLSSLGVLPYTSIPFAAGRVLSPAVLPLSRFVLPPPGWFLLATGLQALADRVPAEAQIVEAFEQLGAGIVEGSVLPLGEEGEFTSLSGFEGWYGSVDGELSVRALLRAPRFTVLATFVLFAALVGAGSRFRHLAGVAGPKVPHTIDDLLILVAEEVRSATPSALTRRLLGHGSGEALRTYERLLRDPAALVTPEPREEPQAVS